MPCNVVTTTQRRYEISVRSRELEPRVLGPRRRESPPHRREHQRCCAERLDDPVSVSFRGSNHRRDGSGSWLDSCRNHSQRSP